MSECNHPDEDFCEECCTHQELDHGVCCDCEKDMTEHLVAAAEYAFEGDR